MKKVKDGEKSGKLNSLENKRILVHKGCKEKIKGRGDPIIW